MIPEDLKKTLWEAIKEPLRLLVLGAVSVAIDWLITNITTLNMSVERQVIVLFVLRFVDKLLHEWGKDIDSDTITLGLTRF